MHDAKRLREQAELILSHEEIHLEPGGPQRRYEAARELARAYLAANPPDELADPDWLNGLSREGGDGTLSMFTIRVVGREIRLVIGDYVAEKPLTRNAMRKLAEAFNIVLREEPAK